MYPEIKQMWVDALRSGNYKQGRGALRSADDEYCCLGVLCDLAVKSGVEVDVTFHKSSSQYAYDNDLALPPESVKDWAGLGTPFYILPGMGKNEYIPYTNDVRGWSFEQIADVIEKGEVY